MASNYTENYGLCQWEATDAVLRTDFNGDNAKLEEVLSDFAKNKADYSYCTMLGDVLGDTNRKLNDLIARVEALEAKP